MFRPNKWPFTPVNLKDILDQDTLAVLQTGSCERLGRAMTIIDVHEQEPVNLRIEPVNPRQQFDPFCKLLRDESQVSGGNTACEACDIRTAKDSLEKFPHKTVRTTYCHMGLKDTTCMIRIREHPVAVLFSGQHRPPQGVKAIKRHVQAIGQGKVSEIRWIDPAIEARLITLADELQPAPDSFPKLLKKEAEHIQEMAEAAYQRQKTAWEQSFLDELRTHADFSETTTMPVLRENTENLLRRIKRFCRSRYVAFFASVREQDTVLAPIACVGIPGDIKKNLPHFNWKKAELPSESRAIKRWNLSQGFPSAVRGIRGDNSHFFDDVQVIAPTTLGKGYRGVLILGPFDEGVDLKEEQNFLIEIGRILGMAVLTELHVFYLQHERERYESTTRLLTHQLRTALTPITTQIGSARLLTERAMSGMQNGIQSISILDSLARAERLCLHLGKTARDTLAGHTLHLEKDDLRFENYPLSVLIANCVESFQLQAQQHHRQLILEESVESLPEIEVDVARMSIAVSNLIENALKYSFPNTEIIVGAKIDLARAVDTPHAIITIDNLGDEIRQEDQKRIFEQGKRGLTRAKMGRIEGTGLGLWEARAVVEAHGGKISASCRPTSIYRRQGRAYHVIFSVVIPLKQDDGAVR